MAGLGTLVFLVAALGALLYRRGGSSRRAGSCGRARSRSRFPFLAALAGWVLTEVGRQPWIVQGLLRTADAHSPNVSAAMLGTSLGIFAVPLRRARRRRLRADAALRERVDAARGRAEDDLPAPAVAF